MRGDFLFNGSIGVVLGMALDDMAVAPLIYKKAIEKGIGVRLPL